MKPINPDYPSMVKEVRKQLASSQVFLAREQGVSYATINRWEKGQSRYSKPAKSRSNAF